MTFGGLLILLVLLVLIGALPAWPHSRNWGYAPSGGLAVVLAVILLLLLFGRI